MGKALCALSDEDPTFTVRTDEDTGQTIIAGMGELHLEVLVDRMLREFAVEATVGKPQVAYRETITGSRRVKHTLHATRSRPVAPASSPTSSIDARAHRPRRRLRVRRQDHRWPHPQGVHPGGQPRHPAGPRPRACSPTTRWSTSGRPCSTASYHDVDSSEMAFKIAGLMAFKEAAPQWPSRSSSSRSWPSRSSRPRTTWATSWATCPPAGGSSAGMRAARQQPRSSGPTSRSRRCSATLPTCVAAHPGPRHLHHAVRQLPAGAERNPGRDRHQRQRCSRGRAHRQLKEDQHGQGEVRADQAPPEHGDDGAHRPWQDDADGGDHSRRWRMRIRNVHGDGVRSDRQGAGGEAAGYHDQHRPYRVRDGRTGITRMWTCRVMRITSRT